MRHRRRNDKQDRGAIQIREQNFRDLYPVTINRHPYLVTSL